MLSRVVAYRELYVIARIGEISLENLLSLDSLALAG